MIGGNKPRWVALWVALLLVFAAWGSAWAQCICQPHGYNFSPSTTFPATNDGQCIANAQMRCTLKGSSWYGWSLSSCKNIVSGECECTLDSIACVQGGDTWTPSQVAGECGECSKCTQSDTLFELKSCAYDSQKGLYLNLIDYHQIKDCQDSSWQRQYYSAKCDTVGNDTIWTCIGSIDGQHVMIRNEDYGVRTCDSDGSCSEALRKNSLGQCNGGSSSSHGSSSSQSSSSSDESSSSQSSSSNDDDSSSSGDDGGDNEGWEGWMKDSLGAIHGTLNDMFTLENGIYDGVWELSGTAHDMNTNLITINEYVASIDDKMTTNNNLLGQIANKDFSPDIHVSNNTDVTGIINAQNETTDSLHNTNNLLSKLGEKLDSLKLSRDTIHIDTSKAPHSIDSTLKFWGNESNRTFGNAGLDTNGWGKVNDSAIVAKDSALLAGSWVGVNGCDTTGGRKCDNSIIGTHGLDSARGQTVAIYGELKDSLVNGAFADSLNAWGGKFTGNGVLTGSGSNSCPSVISRTYRVDLIEGVGYDFTLGTYLCSPLIGNVTAWQLCRMLLRASVALACMWFLFKCATGFSKDED